MLLDVVREIRQSLRTLLRSPIFALTALGALALGVGANSAVFTLMDRLMLRPLPGVQAMDRLAFLDTMTPSRADWAIGLNPGNYYAFRAHATQAVGFGAWATGPEAQLGTKEGGSPVPVFRMSWDLFPTLGLRPALGRTFTPEEDREGGPQAVLLSHELWQRRFGGDPGVVGRSLNLDGTDRTIVGVAPPIRTERMGRAAQSGILLPLAFSDAEASRQAGGFLKAVARLAPGATAASLDAELRKLDEQLPAPPSLSQGHFVVRARPLRDAMSQGWRDGVLLQAGAMAALLLIACANVASMLLARGLQRRHEMAVRFALGGGRFTLARQALHEATLLGLGGGLGGLFLGKSILRILVAVMPPHPALDPGLPLEGSTVAVTLLLGLASSLVFGLVPALRLTQGLGPGDLQEGKGLAGSQDGSRLRRTLVVGEMAMATAMLICAMLLVRSVQRLTTFRPGYDPAGVLEARLTPRPGATNQPPASLLLERIQAMPGVRSASLSWMSPTQSRDGVNEYRIPGEAEGADGHQSACNGVTRSYFETLGIRFREGRTFQPGEQDVVIVNEGLARLHWPGTSALGKTLQSQSLGYEHTLTVVGVVEDVRVKTPGQPQTAQTYFPFSESSLLGTLALRTQGSPLALRPALERTLAEVAPQMQITRANALEDLVEIQSRDARAKGILLSAYAATALALAALGIYGIMAFTVGQRRREMGVRMALGATCARILFLALGQGLKLTAGGVLLGLAAGLALGRALASELFETSPLDPASLGISLALLSAVAAAACLIPSLRAARIQPSEAMRNE